MTTLRTEDLGLQFEKAACIAFSTPYTKRAYKYGDEVPTALAPRIAKLVGTVQPCIHSSKRNDRYDLRSAADPTVGIMNLKTTKKDGKVAPEVIGQAMPKKFCETLGIPFIDAPTLKRHWQEHLAELLPSVYEYTFSSPILYYNQHTDSMRYIVPLTPIPWAEHTYTWTCNHDVWNNSCTFKVKTPTADVPILEVQFHSKSRKNMVVRWCFENLLTTFAAHFQITDL